MKRRTYEVAVVGESFSNADGVPRQEIIARLAVGSAISLRHESTSQHSDRAVGVYAADGMIGFIGRDQPWVFDRIMEGRVLDVRVKEVAGKRGMKGVWLDVVVEVGGRDAPPSGPPKPHAKPHRAARKSTRNWLLRLLGL